MLSLSAFAKTTSIELSKPGINVHMSTFEQLQTLNPRRLVAVTGLVLGLTTACVGSEENPNSSNDEISHSVESADNRYYDCFAYTTANRGGLSCTDITNPQEKMKSNHDDDIEVSTETVSGRDYHCFTYNTVNRGGIDCEFVSDDDIDAETSDLEHNDEIRVSHESSGGREYDCFAYTLFDRGGVDCVPVA